MITKESLVDLQEKFEKVRKLIDEDARFDPETQPYFSKYAARQQLISMNALLDSLRAKQDGGDLEKVHKLIGMHGAVQLHLGIIAVDTEELSIGEKHLNECEKIIEGNEELPQVASVALNLYNQLGILWAKRDQEKGRVYLEKADLFYKKVKELSVVPIDFADIFTVDYEVGDDAAMEKFEKVYTLTLYYLAQVYGPVDSLKSAVYCHRTLQRQLESGDYDHIDWALNTATLSQFLMERNGFKQARHHLCASLYMLDEYKALLDAVETQSEEHDAKVEMFKHRSADVARCWGKYGIILLSHSHERLMNCVDVDVTASNCTDISKMSLDEGSTLTSDDLKNLDFPTLDLSDYSGQVTDSFVLTIEDARLVFKNAQKWLLKAQEYYTLGTLASDYIEIAQDHGQLYDLLVGFEDSPENRTKLLKRAVDILENVLKEVNPTYYMPYCRQIWFKLGTLYADMLDLKLDKLKEKDARPSPHALLKVNGLVDKSSRNFDAFVDSFKNADGVPPRRVPVEVEKAYLQAFFQLAALHTRRITLDKSAQLANTERSLEAYRRFVAYCAENEKAGELVGPEMSVVKEMVTLLPLKIARLRNELPQPAAV